MAIAQTEARDRRNRERVELAATALMAAAAILTAWAAFQSAKWSGAESEFYSRAAAARTESARATTLAANQTNIDVQTFIAWLTSYRDDLDAGLISPEGSYVPDPATTSGFIANRFREEFRPAFEAWMATRPVVNAEAAGTPFELPEYRLDATGEANRLQTDADQLAADARRANGRGDNYVMLTVLFAAALFFAGISHRIDGLRPELFALGAATVVIIATLGVMLTFPPRF